MEEIKATGGFPRFTVRGYTAALISFSAQNGLLGRSKQEEIAAGIRAEFLENAAQLTYRESSTIPKRLAEKITGSVFYFCDAYLSSFDSGEKALEAVNSADFEEIIRRGKAYVAVCFEESKRLHDFAVKTRIKGLPVEYDYALGKAFEDYERNYSARRDAENICCDIDYPLAFLPATDIPLSGAMFMRKYYGSLWSENRFLTLFGEKRVGGLLDIFGKKYGGDYRELLFNAAEVTANNFFFRLLIGKGGYELDVTSEDISAFNGGVYDEKLILDEIFSGLSGYNEIVGDIELYGYVTEMAKNAVKPLADRIKKGNIGGYLCISDTM